MSHLRPAFKDWLQRVTEEYSALNDQERNVALDTLIAVSGSSQLLMLSSRLPDYVFRDFISDLPLEISLLIIQYLDGHQLCICCQVSKSWNERISSFSRLWMSMAQDVGVDTRDSLQYDEQRCSDEGDANTSLHHNGSSLHFKQLYIHAINIMRGLRSGSSIILHSNFIEKDSWRITSVKYFNGNVVTGCDDHTVQIWSVPDGKILHSISTNSVCCLTLSRKYLYTASFNANAESWDIHTGHHLKTFPGHTSAVLAIDVTPDEVFLLTGSVDKTAKLWDLKAVMRYPLIKTFDSVHEDWVFHVKFLQKGENHLLMATCDANMICLWETDLRGNVLSTSSLSVEGSAKFTSFYHHPNDLCKLFACQWTEWTKSSGFFAYTIGTKPINVVQTKGFALQLEGTKAFLLGAGLKFAVIMCSISRKDFIVLDLQKAVVVATIGTPYFYILTRNGSTVTLCDTQWLDGFCFSKMKSDTPVFAAWISIDKVMLGTWAKTVSEIAF